MGEIKELVANLVVMFLLAGAAYGINNMEQIFPSNYVIENYSATLTSSGLLYENYTYVLHKTYHMLYRKLNSPLWKTAYNEGIIIQNITISGLSRYYVPYIKDYYGSLWILDNYENSNIIDYIATHASKNEAGIYVPGGLPPGKYVVRYVFLLRPTLNFDGKYYRLPLVLANKHPTYESVNIKIPGEYVVYTSPYLSFHKSGNWWKIQGTSFEDFKLIVDILFSDLDNFSHYSIEHVSTNLLNEAKSSHTADTIMYWFSYGLFISIYALIWILPFAYLIAYIIWGREKKYPEPGEIYFPPSERDLLTVNYVFHREGDGVDTSSLLLATILYLRKKGFIEISDDGSKIFINKYRDDYNKLDDYSRNVLEFITEFSENGVFDMKKIKDELISKNKYHLDLPTIQFDPTYQTEAQELLIPDTDKILDKYMINRTKSLEKVAIFGILCLVMTGLILIILHGVFSWSYTLYSFLAFMDSAIFSFSAISVLWHLDVLGKWRDDYYLEKLKWDKFREFLKDEKKLKEKYLEFQDYIDDWLIYGYVLGVGKKVKDALGAPDINLPLSKLIDNFIDYFPYAFFPVTISYSGGAGAGGVGGFGGGGAGAR